MPALTVSYAKRKLFTHLIKLNHARIDKWERRMDGQNKFKSRVLSEYRLAKRLLSDKGFQLSPAEAVFLRRLIEEVHAENNGFQNTELNIMVPWNEAICRFLWHYYGINLAINQSLYKYAYAFAAGTLRPAMELI